MTPSVTVIIVTLNRPDHVRSCLTHLRAQTLAPDQIIVVDASPDTRTRRVVEDEFPEVLYLRNDNGIGRMTASRNIGILQSTGQIIAFIDDDAYAAPSWLENLLRVYEDPEVGAVGGRVLQNGQVPLDSEPDRIGTLLPSGVLLGGFGRDPGKVLFVDHIMGCNMSFRREVIAQLAGFREDYPGISGICEDSDMSLRVGKLGWKIAFAPAAVVDHIGAPQVRGRRFDARYSFYSGHNSVILLIRNRGLFSPIVIRFIARHSLKTLFDSARQLGGTLFRCFASISGLLLGLIYGALYYLRHGTNPVRRDPASRILRSSLDRQMKVQPPEPAKSP